MIIVSEVNRMLRAVDAFALDGSPVSCARYGNGHINETYLLQTDKERPYILQKINHHVFRDVPALMENIAAVTRHLRKREPDPRRVLTLVPTKDGKSFLRDEAGEYWRVYHFVTNSLCLERAQSAADFASSGLAFGRFQTMLADFPADTLHETIPRFHDTPARYAALCEAAAKDALGRLQGVSAEMAFALAREKEAGRFMEMRRLGQLPVRVTHNDTKLNNVMLGADTREPLCVIDLDTVMPGLAANDFGDSIRFGASTAAEDETDLSKVSISLTLYEAFVRGFLGACGERLTPREIQTLPLGAKLMTLECGVRFLTDYLSGDVYFHIRYPEHNLHRCRTQFKLVADMEDQWAKMERAVSAG